MSHFCAQRNEVIFENKFVHTYYSKFIFFRYENGDKAQSHFKSSRHMYNVKDKYRCYFCNSYVQDTKGHLESQHRDMTFKCLLRGCAQPRFTQANKVILIM